MNKPGACFSFAGSAPLQAQKLPRTTKASLNPEALRDPLTVLPGVGPATARQAEKLGLNTIGDLILHFPHRHEDFTAKKMIGDLKWGEEATISCTLKGISLRRTRRRNLRLVEATVSDETGYLTAVWFNQDYLAGTLKAGDRLLVRGSYDGGSASMKVRSHEVLGGGEAGLHTTGFVPVYPTTGRISVRRLRGWLGRLRPLMVRLADPLPAALRAELKLPSRPDAIVSLHFPSSAAGFKEAERRLIFEELYLLQAGLLSHRRHFASSRRGAALGTPGELTGRFIQRLPFSLTGDQERVCSEISADLARGEPMQRLLQGDVGSGKTVVAVYALLRAVESGLQGAFMAPTEVLAEQHYFNLEKMLEGLGVRLAFISSRLKAKERQELIAAIGAGDIDIGVGTHALIQEDVSFAGLGVVVVDEQHRFGVRQRDRLAGAVTRGGLTPHVLHMTATPIPRTLALTLYGDLEVSTIHKLPAGRRRIKTWLVPEAKRAGAYDFIRGHLDAGRQCYVVCPLIEESEAVEARAVEEEARRLSAGEFKGYRVAVLHGQMPPEAKQEAMGRFAGGETQVLVTTTVVEVGVDVANATIMMVEEADRFGLAQLHQLRGRVGRGRYESCCLLFGEGKTEAAEKRLRAMTENSDGFALADLDLEIRGEGQLFGTRQSGLPDLRLARLTRDRELLKLARQKAAALIDDDPGLSKPENVLLREGIEEAFGESVDWLCKV